LFLLPDELLLETDQDHLSVKLSDVVKIVPARADQIRKIPDKKLCAFLESGSCRIFSALREMIRRHDSLLRQTCILFIVKRDADGEPADLVVLAAEQPVCAVEILLKDPQLKGKISRQFSIGPA
jgi:hypothetical protein